MHDVLIIGAGPTGLFLAYLLKKRGVDVRIIDKGEGPSVHSKALGVHPKTMEIFQREGIVDDFVAQGLQIDGVKLHHGKRVVTVQFTGSDSPFPYVTSIPQTATERILLSHLTKLGVSVEWNTEVVRFDGTTPILADGTPLEGKWIVGCDGARSLTRTENGFSFSGKSLDTVAFLADVEADTPFEQNYFHPIFGKERLSVLFPLPDNRFRIIMEDEDGSQLDEEQAIALFARYGITPFEVKKVHWLNTFYLSKRMVSTLKKENLFIMGDAAHIHSPVGGRGMNTCFHDVDNLAWKLTLVLQNRAPESLLETVSEERIPVIRGMLRRTTFGTRVLQVAKRLSPNAFFTLIEKLTTTEQMRGKLTNSIFMTSLTYKPNGLFSDGKQERAWRAPRVGMRCPNPSLAGGEHLYDALKGVEQHALLLFSKEKQKEAEQMLEGRGVPILIEGEVAKEEFQASPHSFFLIRPDGYIALRSQGGDLKKIAHYFEQLGITPASVKQV